MTNTIFFEKPIDIYELKKTYSDNVEFISDTFTFPLVKGIRYEGQLHKAIKGKLKSKDVKKKVDRLLEVYKRRLFREWDDHFKELLIKLDLNKVQKGGPGSGRKPEGKININDYVPALRSYDEHGKPIVIRGKKGDNHFDIWSRELATPDEVANYESYDTSNYSKVERGFIDNEGNWLNHDQLNRKTGVGSAEQLRMEQDKPLALKFEKAEEDNQESDSDKEKKKEIIAGVLLALGNGLSDTALDYYKQAYLLGKERGVSISGQDFKREISKEAYKKLESMSKENKDYLLNFMNDLEDKYSDVIDKEYDSKEAEEQALNSVSDSAESRLNLYIPAILGALAFGMTDGVKEGKAQAEENGEEIPEEVTGIIWVTNHDDNVCDGCADNDGKFFTFDEFEDEYQNNECLTKCRCAETSEPTANPPEHFARSARLSTLQKGGPGSGCQGITCGRPKLNINDIQPALNDSGRIFVGKKGQLHSDIFNDHETEFNDNSNIQTGFVDKTGKFLTRADLDSIMPTHHLYATAEGLKELQESAKKFDKFLSLKKGGPGSGCSGPNCGRPESTGTISNQIYTPVKMKTKYPNMFEFNSKDPIMSKVKADGKPLDKFAITEKNEFIPVARDERHGTAMVGDWGDYDRSIRVIQDPDRKLALIRMGGFDGKTLTDASTGDERAMNTVLNRQREVAENLYGNHPGYKVVLASGGSWRFDHNNLPNDLDNGHQLVDNPEALVDKKFIYTT